MSKKVKAAKAGLGVAEWSELVGFSRATYYNLRDADRPRHVKIGDRILIFETPGEWLKRMEKKGEVETISRRESDKAVP